jgi:glyoxylase-like metal-dependent hydrolase (beta-lactamase superfamily II)
MRPLIAFILAALSWAAGASDIVRYVSDEQGFAVNSWLVPTAGGLVVIDTQFTVSEAEKLSQAITKTALPVRAVIITHPHPDHFNGICRLLQIARVPIYATRATIDGIRATADVKRAQWKPMYGADYPDQNCEPDSVVANDAAIRIDGTVFRFQDFGPGEASDESIIVVPSLKAVFVGDLIYQNMHPWLAEGRSERWLLQLDRLQSSIPQDYTIYPGHGAAASTVVIGAQRRYIENFRSVVKSAIGSDGLSADASQAIVAHTRNQYPGWPLDMLIPVNAAAMAKEFASGPAP